MPCSSLEELSLNKFSFQLWFLLEHAMHFETKQFWNFLTTLSPITYTDFVLGKCTRNCLKYKWGDSAQACIPKNTMDGRIDVDQRMTREIFELLPWNCNRLWLASRLKDYRINDPILLTHTIIFTSRKW